MDFLIPSPSPPVSINKSLLVAFDMQVDRLLRVPQARDGFRLDGEGLAVAVMDTGLRVTHECFKGRVTDCRNYTKDDGGDVTNVSDYNGHGTNVTGLIAAGTDDERRGIAPKASIVPIKIIPVHDMDPVLEALNWIYDNSRRLNISAINWSSGLAGVNEVSDEGARKDYYQLYEIIAMLSQKNIAMVCAAGNAYKQFEKEGMSVPAIFRETISVGAVYDASVGSRVYGDAIANTTRSDQITPYTQRLSRQTGGECYTDIFSAGGMATSAGALDDQDTSTQDGTSQASPTVTGVVMLMQQHYLKYTGKLPEVSLIQDALRSTSRWLVDGDNEDDNVVHTGKKYPRIDALESIAAVDKYIKFNGLQAN